MSSYKYQAIVIGASAGGLEAFKELMKHLRGELAIPVMVVQHVKKYGSVELAEIMKEVTGMNVKEAEPNEPIIPGVIYLAPADYHLAVESDRTLSLLSSELVNFSRPSIDVLFSTAAEVYREGLIGVILSGSSRDGSEGLLAVKKLGGLAVVQKPEDAEFDIMPLSAINSVKTDFTGTISELAEFIKDKLNYRDDSL